MGMFDSYEPVPALTCPCCTAPLEGWQGKGGPCDLVTWKQGEAKPTLDGRGSKERRLDDGDMYIYTECDRCYLFVNALCSIVSGVWQSTQLELPTGDLIAQAIDRFIVRCNFAPAIVVEALAQLSKGYREL